MFKITNGKPINDSIKEYSRGIIGGMLFSFPLLYTMEMWWQGFMMQPLELVLLMVVTFGLLLGYNRFSGMHPGVRWKHVFIDSFEEMGLGLVLSFLILLMLNRIPFESGSVQEIIGKVILEAMAVSIGVSIGTAQLQDSSTDNGEDELEPTEKEKKGLKRRSGQTAMIILALCGSIVIGSNVAPAREIHILAAESKPYHTLIMATISLLLCLAITFLIDFRGSNKSTENATLREIMINTSVCYSVALIASTFILWFFDRFENMGAYMIVSQIVILGVISTLGASAGRLLIK